MCQINQDPKEQQSPLAVTHVFFTGGGRQTQTAAGLLSIKNCGKCEDRAEYKWKYSRRFCLVKPEDRTVWLGRPLPLCPRQEDRCTQRR